MVTLEPLAPQHSELLLRWRNLPEVARWMYTNHRIERAEHDPWFSSVLRDRTQQHWVICDGGSPVGKVHLAGMSPAQRSAVWGIYVAEESARGRGVGEGAVLLSLDAAFGELDLDRVTCEALAGNDRAIALYERMGFRREGFLRGHVRRGDERLDVVPFGIMCHEWRMLRVGHARRLGERGVLEGDR